MNDMLEDLRLELIKIKGALDTTIRKYMLNQAGFPYIGISQSAMISGIALIQAIKACEEWSDIQHHIETACSTVQEDMDERQS